MPETLWISTSTGFGALEEGLVSSWRRTLRVPLTSDSDRKVPADLGQDSQASSWVEALNSACLSRMRCLDLNTTAPPHPRQGGLPDEASLENEVWLWCVLAGSPLPGRGWFLRCRRGGWGGVVAIYLFWKWTRCLPHPASLLRSARGEVDSNGLNSEEKTESTIGRKIKIIKTNSNCSQRNQFHNFSASLSLLLRLCSAEQRACTGECSVQTQVCVYEGPCTCVCAWTWCTCVVHVHIYLSIYTHVHVLCMWGHTQKCVSMGHWLLASLLTLSRRGKRGRGIDLTIYCWKLPCEQPLIHSLFFLKIILFTCFWQCWVFVAMWTFLMVQHAGFSLQWLLLCSMGSGHMGFSSCSSSALEHRLNSCGTWA